jgi:hypothetical protein
MPNEHSKRPKLENYRLHQMAIVLSDLRPDGDLSAELWDFLVSLTDDIVKCFKYIHSNLLDASGRLVELESAQKQIESAPPNMPSEHKDLLADLRALSALRTELERKYSPGLALLRLVRMIRLVDRGEPWRDRWIPEYHAKLEKPLRVVFHSLMGFLICVKYAELNLVAIWRQLAERDSGPVPGSAPKAGIAPPRISPGPKVTTGVNVKAMVKEYQRLHPGIMPNQHKDFLADLRALSTLRKELYLKQLPLESFVNSCEIRFVNRPVRALFKSPVVLIRAFEEVENNLEAVWKQLAERDPGPKVTTGVNVKAMAKEYQRLHSAK